MVVIKSLEKPRLPSEEEIEQLISLEMAWLNAEVEIKPDPENRETIEGFLKGSVVSVWDRYTTDSPGYSGKIMVVVWPTMDVSQYTWEDGKITSEHLVKEFSLA